MELSVAINTVWVLVATAFVFFMQAGFVLIETGFTRAKNPGKIILKNYFSFLVGTIVFWIIGFGIMYGGDRGGLIGIVDFLSQRTYPNLPNSIPQEAFMMFQMVLCSTSISIVSGAMAGRGKISTYLFYTIVMSAVIYPVAGHWVWGGGWLEQLGFHDFAGSTVIHSVGGWVAFVAAYLMGPRIGKYSKDGKSHAIPGSNLTYGAIGVIIIWLGWFGFNPGSTFSATKEISHILLVTYLSGAAAAAVTLFITWLRYKQPDVSMMLNGALGGLVAITAGADSITPIGAVCVGAIAAMITVYGIEYVDHYLHIDDPVGSIGVNALCGVVGTLLVGLLSKQGGILYNGDGTLLLIQFFGVIAIAIWSIITSFILFTVLKKFVGIRISPEEEQIGLPIEPPIIHID